MLPTVREGSREVAKTDEGIFPPCMTVSEVKVSLWIDTELLPGATSELFLISK